MGFEPTITEFRLDHEFNSYSEPTLYSYSNFIFCLVSHFILVVCLRQSHRLFWSKFSVCNHMICVYLYIYTWYIYIKSTTEIESKQYKIIFLSIPAMQQPVLSWNNDFFFWLEFKLLWIIYFYIGYAKPVLYRCSYYKKVWCKFTNEHLC